jgi:hypothetical protein
MNGQELAKIVELSNECHRRTMVYGDSWVVFPPGKELEMLIFTIALTKVSYQ